MSSWELEFFPKQFAADHQIEELASYQLKPKQLEKYALVVTKLRENLRARALRIQKYRELHQEGGSVTMTKIILRKSTGHYDHQLLETRKALKRITRAPAPTLLRKKGKYK